jgi:hypothetical protein
MDDRDETASDFRRFHARRMSRHCAALKSMNYMQQIERSIRPGFRVLAAA